MILKGVIPPIVTPLIDRDTIDQAGLQRLIDHVLDGGVHGIFVLGTTGEGPSLSYELRRQMITLTCQHVAGRVPVVAAISDSCLTESVRLAHHAADAGIDAVVAAPPYYFPIAASETLEYFTELNAEVPLPLILYNMPGMTKVDLELETVRRLMDQPNIVGIKDSSCSMLYYQKLLRLGAQRDDWDTLVGPEEFLCESVMQGGSGGVAGGANVAPRLFVDAYQAVIDQRFDDAMSLHQDILRLGEELYTVGQHGSRIIKGIKCVLSVMGICDDCLAPPLHRFAAAERNRISEALDRLGSVNRLQAQP